MLVVIVLSNHFKGKNANAISSFFIMQSRKLTTDSKNDLITVTKKKNLLFYHSNKNFSGSNLKIIRRSE